MMDITDAIAKQLSRIAPGVAIYRENQEQAFLEPSFYISEINAEVKGELMQYEMRTHLYSVLFFPDTRQEKIGPKEQCELMCQTFLDEFQRIDELSLGLINRKARLEEDRLNFTFKIKYRVRNQVEVSKLEGMAQKGGIKHGKG